MATKSLKDIVDFIQGYAKSKKIILNDYDKRVVKDIVSIAKRVYNKKFTISFRPNEACLTKYHILPNGLFSRPSPFNSNDTIAVYCDCSLHIHGYDETHIYEESDYQGNIYVRPDMTDAIDKDYCSHDCIIDLLNSNELREFFHEYLIEEMQRISKEQVQPEIDKFIVSLQKKEDKIKKNACSKISKGLCDLIRRKSLSVGGEDIKILKHYLLNKREDLAELITWTKRNRTHFKYVTDEILDKVSNDITVMDILE